MQPVPLAGGAGSANHNQPANQRQAQGRGAVIQPPRLSPELESLVQSVEELKNMKSFCLEVLHEAEQPNEVTGSIC